MILNILNFELLVQIILFQCLFLDKISFETKQKSKYKVSFNFILTSIEKHILEIS